MTGRKTVLENIERKYTELFKRERKVADFIRENPDKVIMMNVAELAAECGVSDATIVRMCQHAGYQGYHQLRLLLSRDVGRRDEEQMVRDEEKGEESRAEEKGEDFIDYVMRENMESMRQLSMQIEKETLLSAVKLIMQAESVYIAAIGNMTPVAGDLEFRLGRFGIRAYTANKSEVYLNYISMGTPRDVLIAISRSGVSKRVIRAAEMAKEIGMKIIAITGKQVSPLARIADYTIPVGKGNGLFVWEDEPASHVCELIVNDLILYAIKCLGREALGKDGRGAFIDEVKEITSSDKM